MSTSIVLDVAIDIALVVGLVGVAGVLVVCLLVGLARATDDDESGTP